MVRYAVLMALVLCIGGVSVEGWAAGLTKPMKLPLRLNSPMRLSPDGKKILLLQSLKKGGYRYAVHDIASGKTKAACDAPGLADDLFFFAFGRGMWAPDSKSFIMIQRISMKQGGSFGPTTLARCFISEKPKRVVLPIKGSSRGGVFGPGGAVFFVRNLGTRRQPRSQLCRWKPGARKSDGCLSVPGEGFGLSLSPDGSAIGGLAGGRGGVQIWAHRFKQPKIHLSRPFKTNDYLWKPLAYWSRDSRSLFANGDMASSSKRRFSIFQFRPFARKQRFQVHLKDKAYNTMGEIAPGVLLVFRRRGMVPHRYVLAKKSLLPASKAGTPVAGVIGLLGYRSGKLLVFTGKKRVYLLPLLGK